LPQMLACVVAYTARSFRVPGSKTAPKGSLESLTTLFERFASNDLRTAPRTLTVTQKPTEFVAMQRHRSRLIFMVSGAIIESNVES
jgi:hypothetical protein